MKLSVIIPTHNREALLGNTLAAVARQSLAHDRFEVIVVDDGSPEDVRPAIRRRCEAAGVRLIEKPGGGLASARNRGAHEAEGDILCFLDDDVEPAPEAFARHLDHHERGAGPRAVVGSLPFPQALRRDPFVWYLEQSAHYDLYLDPDKYPGGQPPLPPLNGNSSLPKATFFEVGGYDEAFRQYGGEDLELGYRLARAGIPFVYAADAVGYHHHVKGFRAFQVDMERAGESLIRLYRKYPEIKTAKKIDIVEDRFHELPGAKKWVKLVMASSLAFPPLLWLPRALIAVGGGFYGVRHLLFPCYRWVGHTAYARGMRRELGRRP